MFMPPSLVSSASRVRMVYMCCVLQMGEAWQE